MICRIKKRENPYVQIDKRPLDNSRMSWRAKGLLCYMLSRPDNWIIRVGQLVSMGSEGRDSVRSALQELREFGYAELKSTSGGKEWVIFEEPQPEKATMAKAMHGFSATTNNDLKDKEWENNPQSPKASAAPPETQRLTDLSAGIEARWVSRLYRRREGTKWSDQELKALWKARGLNLFTHENMRLIEDYYAAERAKPKGQQYHRRDPLTFLRNMSGELSRATEFSFQAPRKSSPNI